MGIEPRSLRRTARRLAARWSSPAWLRFRKVVAVVATGVLGAIVGLVVAGQSPARVGPFDATFGATPALHGDTMVHLAPLGTIQLDTHTSPLRIDVHIEQLRIEEARRIARDPQVLRGLEDDIARDVRRAAAGLAVRSLGAGILGSATLALLRRPHPRQVVAGTLVGALAVAAPGAMTVVTWRSEAIAEPRYRGLLTLAPKAVGNVEDLAERFSQYRAQLASLVRNVSALYQAADNLEAFQPAAGTIRILTVSDLHLNPEGFDLIAQLVRQFRVDAVVDTGDINDWGTTFETAFVSRVGTLGVPYVYVRGNHDSLITQAAVAAQPNAVVLDGRARTVAGLRFWGIGDPRFTPDKTEFVGADEGHDLALREAPSVARRLAAAGDVDVVMAHDPALLGRVGGQVPLALAGHRHRPLVRRLRSTLELIEGSTGGAGLRSLQKAEPIPLAASVLYFDPRTKRLEAFDRVTVSGLGQSSARIERHVVEAPGDTSESTTTSSTQLG